MEAGGAVSNIDVHLTDKLTQPHAHVQCYYESHIHSSLFHYLPFRGSLQVLSEADSKHHSWDVSQRELTLACVCVCVGRWDVQTPLLAGKCYVKRIKDTVALRALMNKTTDRTRFCENTVNSFMQWAFLHKTHFLGWIEEKGRRCV